MSGIFGETPMFCRNQLSWGFWGKSRSRAKVWLAMGLLLCIAAPTWAQRVAYTDPERIEDPDFPFQGEYFGPSNYNMCLGLQVVAKGQGEFTARLYMGGLPGNGWYGGAMHEMKGRREGPILTLQSPNYVAQIRYPRAVIYHAGGSYVATLLKTRRASMTLGLEPPRTQLACSTIVIRRWMRSRPTPSLRRRVTCKAAH